MPIAKETLYIGFTPAAQPGGYVTQAAVDQYGWHDKVDAGPEPATTGPEPAGTDDTSTGRKRKTS
ncbi:MAG: hypothetical protein M3N52_11765 [Actinomycetota bacterium]|nr:hypothetical protein [Actinomycetota bacterium]